MFPTARRQLPVSCSTLTQSTPYLYISSRPIFIPPCHPHLRLPSCLFPSAVPNKTQFISVLSTGSPAHLILLRLIIPIWSSSIWSSPSDHLPSDHPLSDHRPSDRPPSDHRPSDHPPSDHHGERSESQNLVVPQSSPCKTCSDTCSARPSFKQKALPSIKAVLFMICASGGETSGKIRTKRRNAKFARRAGASCISTVLSWRLTKKERIRLAQRFAWDLWFFSTNGGK